jgi:hypothetical protein
MRRRKIIFVSLACCLFILAGFHVDAAAQRGPHKMFDTPNWDHQPSIIRTESTGDLFMAFERTILPSYKGIFLLSASTDDGQTWSWPFEILPSTLYKRHPSMVQLGTNSFVLFYTAYQSGVNNYRIHRATSPDAINWTSHGAIDLGWPLAGEQSPCVIREANGTLTMTYDRSSGAACIAQSHDNGVTWDFLRTRVSPLDAKLARIAKREQDGLYVITYMTGPSSPYQVWSRTSKNPYDWSGKVFAFDTTADSRESKPLVLEGGAFIVFYSRATMTYYDLCYRTSFHGEDWSEAVPVTEDPDYHDMNPHAIRHGTPGRVVLTWSHQDESAPNFDLDLFIYPDLEIPLPLWLDAEMISAALGGTVTFDLDAGSAKADRKYLLLAGVSGTEPGYLLPGGTTTLPLNWDFFTDIVLSLKNTSLFADFLGTLDSQGQATATLDTLGPLPPVAVGAALYFAYCLDYPWEFASNPLAVEIQP